MAATTRWTLFDIASTSTVGTGGGTAKGRGTRGGRLATASVDDSFNIGTTSNRLYITIDGSSGPYITVVSGSDLDPRFVARDITEKLHNLGKATTAYDQAQCVWDDNQFKLYSGTLGSSSSVAVSSGTNTAHLELGFGTNSQVGGVATGNSYNGGVLVSGTYNGFFDEIYHIVINKELNIGTPGKGGGNTYTGVIATGGVYNHNTTLTYTLSIDTTNGTTMGAGTGNVPTISWTSTGSVDDGGPEELLFADYWYKVGTHGLMVKFTDAVFNTCDPAWTVVCTAVTESAPGNASSPVGTARYIWGSNRGDDADDYIVTSSGSYTRLGSRGVTIMFDGSNNFNATDEFFVICTPPQPQSYDITNLNYGNVTVSTESPLRCVIFEIMSGAVEISTVKFGLQSHGSFSHHGAGNDDTYFRFGTVGPGNNAGGSPYDGLEWRANVTSTDIASDTPPSYLYATEDNLSVVADADSSEAIGTSTYAGMVADPIWLNIKLGTSEVGANASVNFRTYFDYS
jgi:hypothetical protein